MFVGVAIIICVFTWPKKEEEGENDHIRDGFAEQRLNG
jgi:hypothetical protein